MDQDSLAEIPAEAEVRMVEVAEVQAIWAMAMTACARFRVTKVDVPPATQMAALVKPRAHIDMKPTSQLAFAVVLGLLTGSCYASEELLRRLIPVDAKSVEFGKVGGSRQVSYGVVREYPSSGIQRDALGGLRKEGWTYCSVKGDEWSSFLDATGGETERIYQRLSYLKKGEHLITIGERYYTKNAAQLRPGNPGGPDDKNQQIVIVEGKPGSKQIDEVLKSSRAICEGSAK